MSDQPLPPQLPYKCIICGREFLKRQSIQAHLKVHKALMCDFSVRIPKSLNDDFKLLCRAHGVTTCHVTVGLLSAAVEGFRRGVTFEFDPRTEKTRLTSGSNPLHITFNQTFLGKPRSTYKVQLPPPPSAPIRGRCPDCGAYNITEYKPVPGNEKMRQGRCQACDAEWLVSSPSGT